MMLDIDKDVRDAILGSFADDTRLWRVITQPQDELILQKELEIIYKWADTNNMSFNSKKLKQ